MKNLNDKWEFCEVIGYITVSDPGSNNFTTYYRKYRRDEIKPGMNLCAYNKDLPIVKVKSVNDEALVVTWMGGATHTLHLGDEAYTPKKGLSYAYSEAEIRLINSVPSITLGYEDVEDEGDLRDRSKWWGAPDLPPGTEYPQEHTFICQIKCEDLAEYDVDGYFPKEGMLYFFADIDEYTDTLNMNSFRRSGEWPEYAFKVIYSPPFEGESETYSRRNEDGTWAELPAKAMTFGTAGEKYDGCKALGKPSGADYNGQLSILQLNSNKDWGLDLGGRMYFVMSKYTLKKGLWEYVSLYLENDK